MKARLLRKCRNKIKIINSYGLPADKTDKKVTVVLFGFTSFKTFKTSKGDTMYIKYGNALNKRREAILAYAKTINNKSLLWHIFN